MKKISLSLLMVSLVVLPHTDAMQQPFPRSQQTSPLTRRKVANNALTNALKENDFKKIESAFEMGADPNLLYKKETLLNGAIKLRDRNTILYFLSKKGINVNTCGQNGNTSLHCAIKWCPGFLRNNDGALDTTVIRSLLEKGAKVNFINNDAKTPIDIALETIYPEEEALKIVKLLLSKDRPNDLSGIIRKAIKENYLKIATYLVDLGQGQKKWKYRIIYEDALSSQQPKVKDFSTINSFFLAYQKRNDYLYKEFIESDDEGSF